MKQLIESYAIGWHPDKGGHVRLNLYGNPKPYDLEVNAAELAAIALILQQSPLYLENGYIHTGIEKIQ